MKSIIISIRPEWACKILNGEKKIEVRKGLALYNALKKAEEKGEEVEFLMYVTKAKPYLDCVDKYDINNGCWHKGRHYLDYAKLKKLPKPSPDMDDHDPIFMEQFNNDAIRSMERERKLGVAYNEHFYNLNGEIVARFKAKAERIKHRYHHTLDDWDGYYIFRGEKVDIMEIELCELSCLNREQLDDYLKGKEGTALHIRDLEIFDKPKTLADYGLKRAPQSWAYAKENKQ